MTHSKLTCPQCGHHSAFGDARFCTTCGAPLDADSAAAESWSPRKMTVEGIEAVVPTPFESSPDTSSRGTSTRKATMEDWDLEPLDAAPPQAANQPASPYAPAGSATPARPPAARRVAPTDVGDGSVRESSEEKLPAEDEHRSIGKPHEASAPKRGKDDQMTKPNPPVQEKRTIVEEGTKLRGDLESACPVVVNGCIEGDVQAPSLTVSATGVVQGTARVGTIQCEGELSGDFDADHIELSGSVKDSTVIRAATIEMKLTAKGGKKQLLFGDVRDADQPAATEATANESATKGEASASANADASPAQRPSEAPPSKRSRAVPVNGRPSQPPPPAE